MSRISALALVCVLTCLGACSQKAEKPPQNVQTNQEVKADSASSNIADTAGQSTEGHSSDALLAKETMEAEDFGCIRDLTPVRRFFVGNFKGDLEGTLAVANSESGGVYPPGSIVQLVPAEVMIKHDKGFNPATKDWEFIELDVTAEETVVRNRGFADVVNRFGNNCFACHIQAKPEFDLVCEDTHGCDPIPVTKTMIKALQNTDPRCDPVELPAEQIEALKQLKMAMEALSGAS